MPRAAAVLQTEREPAGRTQLGDGGFLQGHNKTVANLTKRPKSTPHHRGRVAARLLALAPVFERNEAHTHVLPLPHEAEALDGHDAGNLGLLQQVLLGLLQHGHGTVARGTRRQLRHDHHGALVFRRQEGCRQTGINQRRTGNDGAVHAQHHHRALEQLAQQAFIGLGAAPQTTVEPVEEGAEEAGFLIMRMPLGNGLEHGSAQRGGQCERKEAREADGYRHHDGELAVNIACGAAEESQRHKHGNHDHRHAHNGARNLLHGLDSGFFG